MSVQNFSQEVTYESEGFQLPMVFNIGVAMNVLDFFMEENGRHSLIVSKQLNRRGGRVAFDYAYVPFGIFNAVQYFTVRFSL